MFFISLTWLSRTHRFHNKFLFPDIVIVSKENFINTLYVIRSIKTLYYERIYTKHIYTLALQ